MFPWKSSWESHSHQKLRPKSREVLLMMRMKPQGHTFQRAQPTEYSKYCRESRYTLWKARRVRFCHTFPRELDGLKRPKLNHASETALWLFKLQKNEPSRDRPKSAPYPTLKNSKKTSKCQVFSFTVLKKMDRVARQGLARKRTLPKLSTFLSQLKGFCRKTSKNWGEGGIFIFGKKSHSAEKNWKGGPFGVFQHPFCRKTAKKWRGPFGEKSFPEKSLAVPKKIGRGDPLVSPGKVCYAGKQEKPFWFSPLDQIVQFGAIIFCRTFVELFWSVRVDWKKEKKSHFNSRVSLHEAPTKKTWLQTETFQVLNRIN